MIHISYISAERRFPSCTYQKSHKSDQSTFPEFNRNEVVKGEVLKLLGRDRALLLIKGNTVTAKTDVRLCEGDTLSLLVEETVPGPSLRLMGKGPGGSGKINIPMVLSALKENLWETTYENILLHHPSESGEFRELLDDLLNRPFLKSGKEMLEALIEGSGLSWESKLIKAFSSKEITGSLDRLAERDLKGFVSRLLGYAQHEGAELRRFISTIDNVQMLNLMGLEQEGKIFLPVPVMFNDGLFALGQLLICMPKDRQGGSARQKQDRNHFRIAFLLELPGLGPLRADMTVKGREIKMRFLFAEEKTKMLVENRMEAFKSSLGKRGFKVGHVECLVKEPEVFSRSLVREIVKEDGGSIRLVA